MRLLLDEGFPDPDFDPSALDADLSVVPLRVFDASLANNRVPDWFIYLRAHEAAFDALVTRDWRQSAQTEEMWVISRTRLSFVTWHKPSNDPVVAWGQLLAYMPEIVRMLAQHGPSIVFLPRPQLSRTNLAKATGRLGELARQQGRAVKEVHDEARLVTHDRLTAHGVSDRFEGVLRR